MADGTIQNILCTNSEMAYPFSGVHGVITSQTTSSNSFTVTLYDESKTTITSALGKGDIIPIHTSSFTVGTFPSTTSTSSQYSIRLLINSYVYTLGGTTYNQAKSWGQTFGPQTWMLIVITSGSSFEFISDPRKSGYINLTAARIPIEGDSDKRDRSDITDKGKYVTTKIFCGNAATGSNVITATDVNFKAGNFMAYKTSGATTTTASNVVGTNSTNTDTGARLPGYYPIRINGWYCSLGRLKFTRAFIESRSLSSCTVSWMVYCAGTANQESSGNTYAGHCALYILWERL